MIFYSVLSTDFFSMESGGESSYHTAFEHDEYQPVFLKHLEPVTVVEGEPATLECQVAGNPTVWTWFKGDVVIRDSPNYMYKKESNNIYKLVIKVSLQMSILKFLKIYF